MIIYGVDMSLACTLLIVWGIGYAMGMLTSSMVRDILGEIFERD